MATLKDLKPGNFFLDNGKILFVKQVSIHNISCVELTFGSNITEARTEDKIILLEPRLFCLCDVDSTHFYMYVGNSRLVYAHKCSDNFIEFTNDMVQHISNITLPVFFPKED